MTRSDDLERLLDEAREASPAERLPTYRDAIAAFGEEAIEPLATWIDEPVFAAFAIRTLGRIASTQPDAREAVLAALFAADLSTMPDHIARDLDAAVDQLGPSARRAAAARSLGRGSASHSSAAHPEPRRGLARLLGEESPPVHTQSTPWILIDACPIALQSRSLS